MAKNKWKIFIFSLLAVCLLTYQLAYWNRIYPGVLVAKINLGNKSPPEAEKILREKVSQNSPAKLILVAPNKTWEANLADLNFSPKIEESVRQAYQIGRKGNFVSSWAQKKTAWFSGINLPLVYKINQPALEKKIEEITSSLFIPAVNPQFKILDKSLKGPRVLIEPGKVGQEVDKQLLSTAIFNHLSFLKDEPLVLPIKKTNPSLTENELAAIKIRAEKILDKSLTLTFEEKIFLLQEKELIDFLSLQGYHQEKISNFVKNLAISLNRPPQNATFKFESGRVTVFRPAKEGITLKETETNQQIQAILPELEEGKKNKVNLVLRVEKIAPQIKTEQVNNLGIKELLGKGISYFKGSIPSRIHNLVLASSKLNGILVAPGETFSFNHTLGEVSQTTGYQEAYVIKEGRTILGDGGGVCQVSTTLFRAVLNSGLPIEERHPHAYRVSYYEQGFPPGLDATVWEPTVDFKFQNDTPAYILIQSLVETKTKTLIFELYGTADGRISFVSKPRVWDQVPPPPDLYQDDPTLPSGTIKQIDFKAWGAKVAFDWKVIRQEKVLQERTFYSVYRPWQAVFLRGTGASQ